jgi:hypothetical protein
MIKVIVKSDSLTGEFIFSEKKALKFAEGILKIHMKRISMFYKRQHYLNIEFVNLNQ